MTFGDAAGCGRVERVADGGVEWGHYFARRTSRFWPACSRSRLSRSVRNDLGLDMLGPENDVDLLRFGIGFTDVVKVPRN